MTRGKRSPLYTKIQERLRRARQERNFSQRGLAERAGLSFTAIQKIEDGKSIPGADTIENLSRALKIDPCWLAYGRGELPDWLMNTEAGNQSNPAGEDPAGTDGKEAKVVK